MLELLLFPRLTSLHHAGVGPVRILESCGRIVGLEILIAWILIGLLFSHSELTIVPVTG